MSTEAAAFLHAVECHEEVTRHDTLNPCNKPAVALRIDPNWGDPYPVCARHSRAPMVTIPEIVQGIVATVATNLDTAATGWRVDLNPDGTVDEVVMSNASVHLEDLGGAYMLIVEDGEQHIHVTIPSPRRKRAFVYEQYDLREGTQPDA